jgi:predicted restriction endonuclease
MDCYEATKGSPRTRPSVKSTTTREFTRDPLIVAIGKVRARFRCEVPNCAHPTFMDNGNMLHCEVHHIQPLAEGGPDDLNNVACLCAAHHREAHHGKLRK